jgi:signal transduction histidine kinase
VYALIAAPVFGVAAAALLIFRSPADPVSALSGVTTSLLLAQLALFILATGFFLTNYRTLPADDRQSARWVMLAFAAALAAGVLLSTLPDAVTALTRQPKLAPELAALRNNLIWVAALIIPLTFAVAVLRYQLFDIELIVNRALVWGALTLLTMGLYVLIVGALSSLFGNSNGPLAFFLATGVIAVLFQPVRQRLQRAVNRLMYGERDDPYAVLSRLGQRLGGSLAPDAVAPAIVESIGAALKLPYVALTLGSSRDSGSGGESAVGGAPEQAPAATWGKPPAYPPYRLPLIHQGKPVGELILAPRGPGETFSLLDRRLLDDLAKQAGVALYAAQQTWQAEQLAADLQQSRERLVAAREEERRRLRRDLHDGLGPALASLTLKVDAARDELSYDTASAAEMLAGLKGDIQAAIGDIRRLVYDLRPPALDDLGLAASLRLLAERYHGADLAIACDLPERLPPLPAAVEVAIYRITAEALTNVVRHAGARTCRVTLRFGSRVELEISDDGRGTPPDAAAGVGRVSMRERAAELGGECTITAAPGAGTTVRVWLPLAG